MHPGCTFTTAIAIPSPIHSARLVLRRNTPAAISHGWPGSLTPEKNGETLWPPRLLVVRPGYPSTMRERWEKW
ncbi:hypothetical protein VAWG006_21380 [Aeromonas enteropelogenes]|nr:hypothetical protein VAWG006_21380 [Aeromonas enteropelogenes]BEE22050.1 hypothetical protein VAWG007_21450 [Aeromonas enteropelogenes]